MARVDRFPRPGETRYGESISLSPGGKGSNQAVAAARQGAAVAFVGKVGRDDFGNLLRRFLEGESIDLSFLRVSRTVPTGVTVVTVANGQNTVVSVPGASGELTESETAGVDLRATDTFVTQCGIPARTVESLLSRARRAGARTVLNATPTSGASPQIRALADVVVVNELEAVDLAGGRPEDLCSERRLRALVEGVRSSPAQTFVVSRGHRGLLARDPDGWVRLTGQRRVAVDSTGAGDCLVGTLAAELARGAPRRAALRYANCAAGLSVLRRGAAPSMPRRREVVRALRHEPAAV